MFGSSLLLIVLAAAPASNVPAPFVWNDNYSDALKQTQETEKPLLVVLQDPTNAESRAQHAKENPDETQAKLLENYELCLIDVTTEHGKQVSQAFQVESLPFMAVIDKTGSGVLYQHAGQLKLEAWLEKLATHKDGEMPTTRVDNATSGTRSSGTRTTNYSRGRRSTSATSTCYT